MIIEGLQLMYKITSRQMHRTAQGKFERKRAQTFALFAPVLRSERKFVVMMLGCAQLRSAALINCARVLPLYAQNKILELSVK